MALSPDGRFIVSGSYDTTIKVWNIKELREEFTFIGHKRSVFSVAVSAHGRFIVSGSGDNTIKVWNIQERREEYTFAGHTQCYFSDCEYRQQIYSEWVSGLHNKGLEHTRTEGRIHILNISRRSLLSCIEYR